MPWSSTTSSASSSAATRALPGPVSTAFTGRFFALETTTTLTWVARSVRMDCTDLSYKIRNYYVYGRYIYMTQSKTLARLLTLFGAAIAAMALLAPAASAAKTAPGFEQFKGCPTPAEKSLLFCVRSDIPGGPRPGG